MATHDDPGNLLGRRMAPKRVTVEPDAAILYALSIGIGRDPVDPRQLRFVLERDQAVFPTMAHVLGWGQDWAEDEVSIDPAQLLHVSSRLELAREIPLSTPLSGTSKFQAVYDRGPDRGAMLLIERLLSAEATGAPIARIEETILMRNGGGFGGEAPPTRARFELPLAPADLVAERTIMPQAALLYRLNFDRNWLHADPETAAAAGFERPILHGACTQAIVADMLIESACDYDAGSLAALEVRFLAPVFPGATLRLQMWRTAGATLVFQATDLGESRPVLSGAARLAN